MPWQSRDADPHPRSRQGQGQHTAWGDILLLFWAAGARRILLSWEGTLCSSIPGMNYSAVVTPPNEPLLPCLSCSQGCNQGKWEKHLDGWRGRCGSLLQGQSSRCCPVPSLVSPWQGGVQEAGLPGRGSEMAPGPPGIPPARSVLALILPFPILTLFPTLTLFPLWSVLPCLGEPSAQCLLQVFPSLDPLCSLPCPTNPFETPDQGPV